ncbi:MAG: DUF2442 domain-containing protein [Chloroflexi bacterium]|nr:DUF2442 domain-containing protein [Chloroflexota bacterium]
MNTVVKTEVRIKDIVITEDTITAHLIDGRTISVPLVWSWRLAEATPEQRAHYELIGDGHGVHWPDIDEDISAEGMLLWYACAPARRQGDGVLRPSPCPLPMGEGSEELHERRGC